VHAADGPGSPDPSGLVLLHVAVADIEIRKVVDDLSGQFTVHARMDSRRVGAARGVARGDGLRSRAVEAPARARVTWRPPGNGTAPRRSRMTLGPHL
jgi:hypothetical protein